jgi:tetratricopeptide (TPR) repeat protein
MKLVSTTMTGNSEGVIADAIASVTPWVDAVVVVDTGVTDQSLVIARSIAKEKYIERKLPWADDFAAGRNFALTAAYEAGGDWAVMVDTDEEIDLRGEDIRAELETSTVAHLMIAHESGIYVQPRFFKLPAPGRFEGPTHEAYPASALGAATLTKCIFRDKPKSPAQLRTKFERDVRVLRAYAAVHPDQARWHYYLGDALQNLGQLEEAIAAYLACMQLRGWDEESAWACYRAAECRCARGEWALAVDTCADGLARHAGVAELAWLAAFASHKGNNHAQAVWWARTSIALGCFRGCGREVPRVSFRNPFALWEGPYDVLRFALRALGDTKGADEAERLFAEAESQRKVTSGRASP